METITIVHFNDVYNVEPQKLEPVGGAARFCGAVNTFKSRNPLVLFSGDIFSPSIMSTFTHGEQMIPVLDALDVQCAVYGNHEFDFGIEILMDLVEKTTFPWLMSNVVDNETDGPLAEGKITHIIHWEGKKLGLMGLVEREWLDTLATIDADEVTFEDFVDAGRKLGKYLRDEEKCDYVIALTHMRSPNDIRLAENVEEIDLILGGHDHVYEVIKVNGKYILKSGSDFRQFSVVTLTFQQGNVEVGIERVEVTSKYEENEDLKLSLEKYSNMVEGKLEDVLGVFAVPLDGQFSSIRTKETNLGNFVCDVMLAATQSDLALLNSGTLRSDRFHPPGPFTLRDLLTVLPMLDHMTVINITGAQLLQALENSVSQYPKLEGRFPQVAGLSFAFDPKKEPGSRVDPRFVKIGDEFLSLENQYRMVTKSYLQSGRDGYDVLSECPVLLNEEACPELCTAIQNHFRAIKMYKGLTRRNSVHRQSLVTISRRHSLLRSCDLEVFSVKNVPLTGSRTSPNSESMTALDSFNSKNLPQPIVTSECSQEIPKSKPKLKRMASVDDLERETSRLAPSVEGRIIILTEEMRERLLQEHKKWEMNQVIEETEETEEPESPLPLT